MVVFCGVIFLVIVVVNIVGDVVIILIGIDWVDGIIGDCFIVMFWEFLRIICWFIEVVEDDLVNIVGCVFNEVVVLIFIIVVGCRVDVIGVIGDG